MYDAIIFTGVSNWQIPMKTIGAYKIAQSMRQRGYKVKVINNFLEVWDNHREDLILWMRDRCPLYWVDILWQQEIFFSISKTVK